MTVAICNRCSKLISLSLIPEGNPVALKDHHWAATYRSCDVCGQLYCEKCSEITPLCPGCPGPRKPVKESDILKRLMRMCDSRQYVTTEYIECAWEYCRFFNTETEGIKILAERLEKAHLEIVVQAAKEKLASLNVDGLGFGFRGALLTPDQFAEWLVSREFIEALSQMKKVAST